MDVQKLRDLVKAGKYEFSKHSEREREADQTTVEELEEALSSCEAIEEYPDDPRGASMLVLGLCHERPIHAVRALKADPEEVLLITAYDPSKRPEKWTDDFRGR